MRRMPAFVLAAFAHLAAVAACGSDGSSTPDGPVDAARDLPDAAVPTCTARAGTTIALEDVADGLDQPLLVTGAPGDKRLFVIEQTGAIRVIKDGALLAAPFLDLGGSDGVVQCCGEQGLLALAFHPDFRNNDRFYVHHTGKGSGDHVITEYRAILGTDTADPASGRELLRFADPYGNHNGGMLEFGSDGFLYISIGDGGSGGDPEDRAQDKASLFGKILRIDVDGRTGSKPYGIPSDNPYASSPDGAGDPRPELWHYGLRNPFRFSFDRGTGDIYIGDVGQGAWEEISAGPNVADVNWGWDDREGAHCYEPGNGCQTSGRVDPVVEFNQSQNWKSIMGGQVYRGACFPDLVGTYFYGDHFAGQLWAFELVGGAARNNRQVPGVSVAELTSVHADSLGELYVTTLNGRVRRIIVAP